MEMVAGDGPVAQLEVRLGRAADQLDILGQRELFAGVDPRVTTNGGSGCFCMPRAAGVHERHAPGVRRSKDGLRFQDDFGTEAHKPLLIALLNDLLELDEAHRIAQVELLTPEQRPKVGELKYSIVDVKCIDARGTTYVVEMQVLNVEAFEKRVVYNVAKAYTSQLKVGDPYPDLNDVIG